MLVDVSGRKITVQQILSNTAGVPGPQELLWSAFPGTEPAIEHDEWEIP